jgi:hypothetical protein
VDSCEHCRAKDWIPPPKVSGFWKEQKQDLQNKLNSLGGCVGKILSIAFSLGVLWLLIAIVK